MKILIPCFRRAAIERARRQAELRESEEIRARILDRVYARAVAESNRPAVSHALEGEIVEVWI